MQKLKLLITILIVCINANLVSSQIAVIEFPQTIRPSDAQGIALGLTGSSYHEGLFSIFSNPAGLSFLKRINTCFSHLPATDYGSENLFNQEAFGIGIPVCNRIFVSLNYLTFYYGKLSYYDEYGNEFEGKSGLKIFTFSASTLISKGENYFSFGINAKYYDEKISDFKANVFWFDVGARYKKEFVNNKHIAFGVSLTNLGNDLKADNGVFVIEPMRLLRVGFSHQTSEFKYTNMSILGTIEYQKSLRKENYRWNRLGTGLELQFLNHLFARIGYNFDLEDVKNKYQGCTYGIGFRTPQKLSVKIPIYLSLSYGRGIQMYRSFDQNVVAVEIGFDIK